MKYILLFAILLSTSSCGYQKERNVVDPGIPLSTALKNSGLNHIFGAYWIYKDSISGQRDSLEMTFIEVTEDYTFSANTISSATLVQLCEYNTTDTSSRDSILWNWYLYEDKIALYSKSATSRTPDIYYDSIFHYPFRSEITQPGDTVTLFSSYTVGGNTFSNVAAATFNSATYNINDRFFMQDSVGIVKMYINHPLDSLYRVWELQSYSIQYH